MLTREGKRGVYEKGGLLDRHPKSIGVPGAPSSNNAFLKRRAASFGMAHSWANSSASASVISWRSCKSPARSCNW